MSGYRTTKQTTGIFKGRSYKITIKENGNAERGQYVLNQQGDIIAVLDNIGAVAVKYSYDAWGNAAVTSGSETNYAKYNALTYRGYYYDADLELYYLGSRYYDAVIGRFINADSIDILGVQSDLYDKNLYAYCDNNPVVRRDTSGAIWETIFDVASLGASIVEVAINPGDPWAWAGVAGDVIDLIPVVTGVGETTRVIKTTKEIVEKADTVLDVVTSIRWRAAKDSKKAFIEEYALQTIRGVKNSNTYNKIWSPGKKIYEKLR